MLLAALSANSVSVKFILPSGVRKGQTIQGSLLAENAGGIPVLRVKLTLAVKNVLTGSEAEIPIDFSLGPHEKREFAFDFESIYCGQHIFSCTEFRIYDFLGLRGVRKRTRFEERRLVLPETFPLHIRLSEGELITGNNESFHAPLKGQDATEPFQLRDYVEGDSQKQIHWKLSYKFGRLIVADPSRELERGLLVVWDSGSLPKDAPPDVSDALAESLISACMALTQNDVPYSVIWKSGESDAIMLRDVTSREDLDAAVAGFLSVRGGEDERSLISDFLAELNGRRYPLIAYFAGGTPWELNDLAQHGNTTVFLCAATDMKPDAGDLAVKLFSPENYRSVLRDVAI
jgi:uncharacterized protein (DUF58 family)